MSFVIIDVIIWFCAQLDNFVQMTFGRLMPEILASFSFTLLLYTIGTYISNKKHWGLKMALVVIMGVYSLYKISIWQITNAINTPTTVMLVFLLIVYPFGLWFTMDYFKDWRVWDIKVFNFHTFWIIYFLVVAYYWFTDVAAINIEFCSIYAVFSYVLVYCYGGNDIAH